MERGQLCQKDKMFDDFWKIYPKKEAKGAARKSYERAIKKASPETIMLGLSRYLERIDGEKTGRQFIKLPATFLNQECWDDEYDARPSLRQQLNAMPSDGDTYQQVTRLKAERIEAANRWWKDRGHAPKLTYEYSYRCKHGEPGPEDMAQFEMQIRAHQQLRRSLGFQSMGR